MSNAEAEPPPQLPLHDRKALIARVLLVDLIEYPDSKQLLTIEAVIDLIRGDVETQADSAQPLARYLDELAARVADTARAKYPNSASVRDLTESYVLRLKTLVCCQGQEASCRHQGPACSRNGAAESRGDAPREERTETGKRHIRGSD